MLDDATTDRDLRVPPSNHFEKLRGKLEGLHSRKQPVAAHLSMGWPPR
jgi:proteic killer suppression protein